MDREYRVCRESYKSWIYFTIGLIATAAIRAVTLLSHVDLLYAKIAWYLGVGGFFAFFLYKYRVGEARNRVIKRRGLVEKITGRKDLEDEDYRALSAILCGLSTRKERINYFFIFALSGLAFALALYLDFFM